MGLRISDIQEQFILGQIVTPWRTCFPRSNHAIQLGLMASTPDRSVSIHNAWMSILPIQNGCALRPSDKFPLLVDFAVRFPSQTGPDKTDELMVAIREAWKAATVLDADAEITSQNLLAYGLPCLSEAGSSLAHLQELLCRFQLRDTVGNLSRGAGEADELIEFFDPTTGGIVPEMKLWQSDLSDNTLELLFSVDQFFDVGTEVEHMSEVLGAPANAFSHGSQGIYQWSRHVRRRGVDIGECVFSLVASPRVGSCGISLQAWEFFGLHPEHPVLRCASWTRDLKCLIGFCTGAIESGIPGETRFTWPIPSAPYCERMYGVGLRLGRK